MKPYLLKLTSKCFLLVLLLITINKSYAQTGSGIVLKRILDGDKGQLAIDSSITVQDSVYFDVVLRSKLDTPYQVRNIITFSINEYSRVYLPATFNAVVNIRIYYTKPDLSIDSADQSLTINYDTANAYTMRSSFVFNNAHEVKAKILGLTVPANVLPALVLENEMQLQPVYKLSCTADAVTQIFSNSPPVTDSTDEIIVHWPAVTGADAYDLEWAYIDSSALQVNRYGTPVNPQLVFYNNTTRVTIAGNAYAIPLLYDDGGVLYYRVRAVQEKNNGRIETAWSSDYSGGMGAYSFCGHQRKLNWQSSISFAEDGKRKIVMQYFDGSLRSRQTVTKDNTTNTTVVGEAHYDYQGRPAIQVLPAPTLNNVIKYTRNLNPAMNGAEYDKDNYDYIATPEDYLTASAKPMSGEAGTNKYYGVNNPDKDNGFSKYIPDAEGHAFAETEYTQDNTGRIRRQGGVGATFKLGSNHETKYFYGTPSQQELDALFGTEVGINKHYFKNMVSDANGQYAISYLDMHGRTIATALTGSPENNGLADLPGKETVSVTDSLSGPGSNTIIDQKLVSTKSQTVSEDGMHHFRYQLNPPVLQKKDCNNNTICYTALYDLEIRITDDSYNLNLGGKPFDTIIRNYNPAAILATCDAPQPIDVTFSLNLVKGSYQITKTLTISKLAMDHYRDSVFLKSNVCTTLEEEIEEQRRLQRQEQCIPDCKSCVDSLGTWDTFRISYVRKSGNAIGDTAAYRGEARAVYEAALEACDILCETVSEDNIIRTGMLLDVSAPSGQYANIDDTLNVYSIFYHPNEQTLAPYRRDTVTYLDEAGKPDLVYDENSNAYIKPQLLTPQQFSDNFKTSWANALLKFHPEYCKLIALQKYRTSDTWDKQFRAVESYQEAKQKGYLNPTGISGLPFPILNKDPLSLDNASRNKLEAKLNNYQGNYSLWSMATISVKCQGSDNTCFVTYNTPGLAFNESTLCTGDLDMAWRNFRELYLNAKRDIINDLVNTACPASATNPTANQLTAAGKTPRFNNTADALNQSGLGYLTGGTLNEAAAKDSSSVAMAKMISDNCNAYVNLWIQQLAPCKYNQAALDEIIPKLLQVCKEGGDASSLRGASTVKPGSTYQYRSFEAVLNDYNSRNGITDPLSCNGLLITAPKPYGKEPAYANRNSFTKPDDCECGKLNDLNREYQHLKTTSDTSLSVYLRRTRKVDLQQANLDLLLNACNATGTDNCTYFSIPIVIPVIIQCSTVPACATCEDVDYFYNEFASKYPGVVPVLGEVDSVQQMKNELFANYMNHQLGFSKHAGEYIRFRDSCSNSSSPEGPVVCKPGGLGNGVIRRYSNGGTNVIVDIRKTADNGYIMAGSTTGCGQGAKDGYLIKTDSNGGLLWAKTYGGEHNDAFEKVILTADGGYIAIGSTNSWCYDWAAIFIVKVDAAGSISWNKAIDFGETHAGRGTDILQTTDGNYAFAGLRATGGTNTDWITGVLSDIGEMKWIKQMGSAASREKVSLLENNDTLVAATSIRGEATEDAVVLKIDKHTGTLISQVQYDLENKGNFPNGILKTASGYKLSIMNVTSGGSSTVNGVLMDLDDNEHVLSAWKITSPGVTDIQSWPVARAIDGGVVAAQHTTSSPSDVYLFKLGLDNTVAWSNEVRLPGSERLFSILQNTDGTMAGAGLSNNESAMLMLTAARGKTGCNDTAITIGVGNITGAVTKMSVATQTDIALTSNCISTVPVGEQSCIVTVSTTNCPSMDSCYRLNTGPLLCGNAVPIFPEASVDDITNCSDSTFFAVSAGTVIYKAYRDSVRNDFDEDYIRTSLQAGNLEQFAVTYNSSEYHYTLYYYDQAGNLVKTVPPAGVVKNRASGWLDQVKTARAAGTYLAPPHQMATQYRYNTLNQVVAQKSPDAGKSIFWYDRLGRLVASQNAKQVLTNAYSYTLYDALGRITEVGELTSSTPMTDLVSRKAAALTQWINNVAGSKTQITRTVYDLPHTPLEGLVWKAANLRNRVSWSAVYNTAAEMTSGNRASASFYSYDIHGNVHTLLQDYNAGVVANAANRFKKVVYNYDLISGKVNMVSYQPGEVDAFYHRYSYDAENRITNVATSYDSVYWENDAYYQYYKHGPLARSVLGQQQVQGLDHAYTLQGWLKGVNSTSLSPGFDMGGDGATNGITARDAFGYSLHYFGADEYKSINNLVHPFAAVESAGSAFKPLYNGNIAAMSVNLPKVGEPLLYTYNYDVLNRLAAMNTSRNLNAATNIWTPIAVPDFGENISYDPNGNILGYYRNGNQTWEGKPLGMDSLTYKYNPGTNKLTAIKDSVPALNYDDDIDSQGENNYVYDASGNLVHDEQADIDIEWTVYGKIKRIIKGDGKIINYTYDVAGNRISKSVNGIETRYIRDASGNVMSVYVSGDAIINNTALSQTETHLYGSSRLGINTRVTNVQAPVELPSLYLPGLGTGTNITFVRGNKFFELSNHLGNVLATVADNKKAISLDDNTVDHYEAALVSSQDYYPFGMQMPGRHSALGSGYRYGFNGKENDNEVKGDGNQIDFGARIYDSRIGRWLSIDAVKAPWQSSYVYVSNSPTNKFDPDGNWQTDGHYWTVYLASVLLGIQDAQTIAYYAEYPDTKIHGNVAQERYTWAIPFVQQGTHSLTGKWGPTASLRATRELLKADFSDMQEFGRLLHKLGDTYAHRVLGGSGQLYGSGGFTLDHLVSDGSEPDMIYNRMKDGVYEGYVMNLTAVLSTKYQKFDAVKLSVAQNKLMELGAYAEKYKVSLIGIVNYEVAVAKGEKKFTVHNNQSLLPGDNAGFVKNTKDYLNRKGIKYETKEIYETKVLNTPEQANVEYKEHIGTEFTLK